MSAPGLCRGKETSAESGFGRRPHTRPLVICVRFPERGAMTRRPWPARAGAGAGAADRGGGDDVDRGHRVAADRALRPCARGGDRELSTWSYLCIKCYQIKLI